MAKPSKKKSKLTPEQLSARSKKGWQTRWKKKALRDVRGERDRALNVLRALDPAIRDEVLKRIDFEDDLRQHITRIQSLEAVRRLSVKALREQEEMFRSRREETLRVIEERTGKHWVNAVSPDYIKKDGSIAIEPNAARHTLDSATYWNIHVVMKQSQSEFDNDKDAMDAVAKELAARHDLTLREVWTILMSP